MHLPRFALVPLALALIAALIAPASADGPRIANLWGVSPDSTDYDAWARYDLIVTAGGTPESTRRFHAELRARNEDILVLGTAPLMNLSLPASTPWMKPEWYVYRPTGELLTWWADQVAVPNLTIAACFDALVKQTAAGYGALLDEGALDGVFYDSVVGRATWLGDVDTDRDGVADRGAEIDPLWHERQNAFFERLAARWPKALFLANDIDYGHALHVNGRLFEGAPLLDRIVSGAYGGEDAIGDLEQWMRESRQPPITFAIACHPIGWQGWRVGKGSAVTSKGELERARRDFHRMRAGLAATLMTDAYYAYDLGTIWYGLPWWYAEYDAPLGEPLGPAERRTEVPPQPVLRWQAGDAGDVFGLEDVSRPTADGIVGEVTDPTAAWRRLFGTSPEHVRLEPGKTYRIEAVLDVLEAPTGAMQFNVRTPSGGWEHHDKGICLYDPTTGPTWRVAVTVTPDDYEDYSAEWHMNGAGKLRLRSVSIDLTGESFTVRRYEGGIAVLNTTNHRVELDLGQAYRKLKDDAAPLYAVEVDDGARAFAAKGAWEVVAAEGHHVGGSYRAARKPGEVAAWTFTAPLTDRYTVWACIPGGRDASSAAGYALDAADARATQVLDQRKGDGGWVELFAADFIEGRSYTVRLTSSGEGTTIADALRIESASRFNDGSEITRLTLEALDGTVLLEP